MTEMKPMKFYLTTNCPSCDVEMFKLGMTMIERNGHPVIPVDIGAQDVWDCEGCGASSYTGDLEAVLG